MIKWAIIFFVISVIAGFFGFTGVASGTRKIGTKSYFRATWRNKTFSPSTLKIKKFWRSRE